MLDRLTGGTYRSTPHRVHNASGKSRLSFPFFFDPGFDAHIEPLPGHIARDDRSERWDQSSVHDFGGTYGEYLLGKVSKVFPDLARRVT
jgi:isopenicillin N synthase-like dioxygenase